MTFMCVRAVGAVLVLTAGAAVSASEGMPAVWIPHDHIVDFQDLPRAYTCDDLWYKLRSVLLALGARPDLTITLYSCGRSPSVHLQFSLPREVRGSDTKYASLRAVDGTVLIKEGVPSTLTASDCEFVRQMKTFLTQLPLRVLSYSFTCDAPSVAGERYQLAVQALTPGLADRPVAASTGGQRAMHAENGR